MEAIELTTKAGTVSASTYGFGEVIRQASPDSGTTDTVRDLRGLPTQITDGRAIVTNLTYDNAGRVLTKTYPAATAENITYTYDDVTAGNKGKGRLTTITDQTGTTAFVYDARGNVITETRTISAKAHVVSYVYDLADRVTQITYPSGRIVIYARDANGRITGVTTKQNATAAAVTVASSVVYQPMSNLVQSFTAGNGLVNWNTYASDYELDLLGVYDGPAEVIERTHTRTDALNLTNIWDNVTTANNQSYWYTAANRLQYTTGPWGTTTNYYDGVGNRTYDISAPSGGSTTTRVLAYPAGSNRLSNVTIGATTERSFVHDAAGNITSDTRSGTAYAYAYNKRNRLDTEKVANVLKSTYTPDRFRPRRGRVRGQALTLSPRGRGEGSRITPRPFHVAADARISRAAPRWPLTPRRGHHFEFGQSMVWKSVRRAATLPSASKPNHDA